MPHWMLQHFSTWTDNLFHSVTIFVYLECGYSPHILCTCNCWASFNINLQMKHGPRDENRFVLYIPLDICKKQDERWLYLKKFYWWVATEKGTQKWRHLFALLIWDCFEVNHRDPCSSTFLCHVFNTIGHIKWSSQVSRAPNLVER